MRVITMFLGVLMVAAGVWSFACSGVAFVALAFPIGLVMLLCGTAEAIIYMVARGENRKDNNIWMLADAGVTLILGAMIILGLLRSEVAVPYTFGMWMLSSGFSRVSVALNINFKEKKNNFIWTMGTGILCTLSGIAAFVSETFLSVSTGELIGVLIIIQAVNLFEIGFHMPHVKIEEE